MAPVLSPFGTLSRRHSSRSKFSSLHSALSLVSQRSGRTERNERVRWLFLLGSFERGGRNVGSLWFAWSLARSDLTERTVIGQGRWGFAPAPGTASKGGTMNQMSRRNVGDESEERVEPPRMWRNRMQLSKLKDERSGMFSSWLVVIYHICFWLLLETVFKNKESLSVIWMKKFFSVTITRTTEWRIRGMKRQILHPHSLTNMRNLTFRFCNLMQSECRNYRKRCWNWETYLIHVFEVIPKLITKRRWRFPLLCPNSNPPTAPHSSLLSLRRQKLFVPGTTGGNPSDDSPTVLPLIFSHPNAMGHANAAGLSWRNATVSHSKWNCSVSCEVVQQPYGYKSCKRRQFWTRNCADS